jgi:hypothetical protein
MVKIKLISNKSKCNYSYSIDKDGMKYIMEFNYNGDTTTKKLYFSNKIISECFYNCLISIIKGYDFKFDLKIQLFEIIGFYI